MNAIFTLTLSISICFGIFFLQLYGYYYLQLDSIARQDVLYYVAISSESGFIQMDRFTLPEKRHLLDVKRLIDSLQQILIISTLLSAILFTFLHHQFISVLRSALFLLLIFSVVLLVIVISYFPYLFKSLHPYFFIGDSWLFNKNSQILQLFPIGYFQSFAILYGVILSVFLSLGLFLTSKKIRNKTIT
jgi:uncharacterized membrane protein